MTTKKTKSLEVEVGPRSDSITVTGVDVTGPTKTTFWAPGAPTPRWALLTFKMFFYITGVITLGLETFTTWSVETKLQLAQWVGFSNIAVHLFLDQFGITVDNDPKRR